MIVTRARLFVIDPSSNRTINTAAARCVYKFGVTRTSSYQTENKQKLENQLTGEDNDTTISPRKRKTRN